MSYDLLVIGGGIHGAGIARDAAGRGLSVLLVEKDSLARHTSSASSKLVHGGLRYLEYFHLRLVRESLMERERLLAIAPHLIEPRRFVLPYRSRLRPAWAVRLGLFLYDWMGRRSMLGPSEGVRFAESPYGRPLRPALRFGFVYTDCTTDDSRLVILNAKDAAERGADIRVGHRLVRATRQGKAWRAEIRDEAAGSTYSVAARAIVNAAGPWVGEVLRERLGAASSRALRLVKGSHIVVPRLYEGDQAYALQHADRRLVFVIPYLGLFTLIGTTDVPWSDEPDPAVDRADGNGVPVRRREPRLPALDQTRGRRLELFRHPRAPGRRLEAGLRRDARLRPGHRCARGAAPCSSIVGGKLTTYRILAEQALEKLEPYLGPLPESWTGSAPLPGGDIGGGNADALGPALSRLFPFLGNALARRLAQAYGTRATRLLDGVKSRAGMGEAFGGGLTRLEVDYLVREEWARSADDILWRHTKCGLFAMPEDVARLRTYVGR